MILGKANAFRRAVWEKRNWVQDWKGYWKSWGVIEKF